MLEAAGHRTCLYESDSLGCGQTIASQGILHRGVKYALSTQAAEVSKLLAESQSIWENALAGRVSGGGSEGSRVERAFNLDLRGVKQLVTTMYMWAKPAGGAGFGLLGGITGAAAALAFKSGVKKIEPGQGTSAPAFRDAPRNMNLWEVQETCIEAASLVDVMAKANQGQLIQGRYVKDQQHDPIEVLAAGIGNEALLRERGIDPEKWCQRRPLHMVMARGAPYELFGHCLKELSDKPRLTITTSMHERERVWYIGGDVAETGVGRSEVEQIHAAKHELSQCMPWITPAQYASMRWATLRIDRAEGKMADGRRPDGPVVHRFGRVIAVWPTKLALAPVAAKLVLSAVESVLVEDGNAGARERASERASQEAGERASSHPNAQEVRKPEVACAPWEQRELNWKSSAEVGGT